MQKTAAQLLADLLAALGGIEEDHGNFRALREANNLAKQALTLVTPPTTA